MLDANDHVSPFYIPRYFKVYSRKAFFAPPTFLQNEQLIVRRIMEFLSDATVKQNWINCIGTGTKEESTVLV